MENGHIELNELTQMIDLLYIPMKYILEQMPQEPFMYLHFKVAGKKKLGQKVQKYGYSEFMKIIDENPHIKETNMQDILDEVFSACDLAGETMEIFNPASLYSESSYNLYPYYSPLRDILLYIYGDISSSSFVDCTETPLINDLISLFEYNTHNDTPAFNLMIYVGFVYYLNLIKVESLPRELSECITFNIFKNNSKLQAQLIREMSNKIERINLMERESKKLSIEIQQLKDSLFESNKSKKILEQQVNNNKDLKESFNTMLLNHRKDTGDKLSNLLLELKSQKISNIQGAYERIIEKLNTQVSDLKNVIKDKTIENKKLREEISELSSINVLDLLKMELDENGMSQDIVNVIKPHIPIMAVEPNIDKEDVIGSRSHFTGIPKIDLSTSSEKIGFCKIIGNSHYIKFPDDSIQLLQNIPEGTYLADGQFVLVSSKAEFKFAFPFYCNESDTSKEMILVSVSSIDENGVTIRYNEKNYRLGNIPEDKTFKPTQVIAVDSQRNYIRHFYRLYQNADTLLNSINVKGHTAYYVVRPMEGKYYELRNIETDKQVFIQLDSDKFNVVPHSVVIVNINRVVAYFPTGKFYTLSSFYKDASFAVVSSTTGSILAKKLNNGEEIRVQDIVNAQYIEVGDILKIDEFDNLIDKLSIKEMNLQAKSKIVKKRRTAKQGDLSENELKGNITILGNPKYKKAYTTAFGRYGLKIDLIDGYDSWSKVSRAITSSELMVLTVDFCSHSNMWKLKNESIPVIYAENSGANRLAHQIMNFITDDNKNI